MNAVQSTVRHTATAAQSRVLQLALAGVLGLFIVGFAGFAPMDVVHNVAHDFRQFDGVPPATKPDLTL